MGHHLQAGMRANTPVYSHKGLMSEKQIMKRSELTTVLTAHINNKQQQKLIITHTHTVQTHTHTQTHWQTHTHRQIQHPFTGGSGWIKTAGRADYCTATHTDTKAQKTAKHNTAWQPHKIHILWPRTILHAVFTAKNTKTALFYALFFLSLWGSFSHSKIPPADNTERRGSGVGGVQTREATLAMGANCASLLCSSCALAREFPRLPAM